MVVHLVVRQAVKPYATAFTHKENAERFMNALIESDYKAQFGDAELFEISTDSKRGSLAEIGFKYALQSVIINNMTLPSEAKDNNDESN